MALKLASADKQLMTSVAIRRVKAVQISAEFLFELLKTSGPRTLECEGVPPDAKPFQIGSSPDSPGTLLVFFEHDSFPPWKQGQRVELIGVTYKELRGEAALKALGHQC